MVFISTDHIGDREARKAIDECVQELNQRETQLRQREEKVQAKEQSLTIFIASLLDKKETAEAEIRACWEKLKTDQAKLDAAKKEHAEAMKKSENELKLRCAAVTQLELDIDAREEAVQRLERVGQPQIEAPLPLMPGFRLSTTGSLRRSKSNSLASSSYRWLLEEQQASPDEVEPGRLERPVRVKIPRRRTGFSVFVSEVAPTMAVKARMQNLGRNGAITLARDAWKSLPDEKKARWKEKATARNQADVARDQVEAQNYMDGKNKRRRTHL